MYKINPAGSLSSSQPGRPPCWTTPLAFDIIGCIRWGRRLEPRGQAQKGGPPGWLAGGEWPRREWFLHNGPAVSPAFSWSPGPSWGQPALWSLSQTRRSLPEPDLTNCSSATSAGWHGLWQCILPRQWRQRNFQGPVRLAYFFFSKLLKFSKDIIRRISWNPRGISKVHASHANILVSSNGNIGDMVAVNFLFLSLRWNRV